MKLIVLALVFIGATAINVQNSLARDSARGHLEASLDERKGAAAAASANPVCPTKSQLFEMYAGDDEVSQAIYAVVKSAAKKTFADESLRFLEATKRIANLQYATTAVADLPADATVGAWLNRLSEFVNAIKSLILKQVRVPLSDAAYDAQRQRVDAMPAGANKDAATSKLEAEKAFREIAGTNVAEPEDMVNLESGVKENMVSAFVEFAKAAAIPRERVDAAKARSRQGLSGGDPKLTDLPWPDPNQGKAIFAPAIQQLIGLLVNQAIADNSWTAMYTGRDTAEALEADTRAEVLAPFVNEGAPRSFVQQCGDKLKL